MLRENVVLSLMKLSGVPLSPEALAYNYRFSEERWADVLDGLTEKGLVTYLGDGHYELTDAGADRVDTTLRGGVSS
jgi:Mn-dependent DtxR family transcriptional regulator